MSDAQSHGEGPHEGPIRTPQQLIATVVAAFVLPVVIIILLVNFVVLGGKPAAGSEGLGPEAVARRIQPVGTVQIRDAASASALRGGEEVYKGQCAACHLAGVAGAPKLGDTAAWAPRIGAGFEALLNSALKGKGAMAPQAGGEFSEAEIARAVVYMANSGGANFAEPKAPAAAASAPN